MQETNPDFVLLACSDTKAADVDDDVQEDDVLAAGDLYRGDAFQKGREYAERLGVPWAVLSGKYGVLTPADRVAHYDVSVHDRDPVAWREQVLEGLQAIDALADPETSVLVLASTPYVDPIRDVLDDVLPVEWTAPMEGLMIGEMLSALNELLDDLDGEQCRACGRHFPEDPVMAVECPTCPAEPGEKCRRPSGWSGPFTHPHASRDRMAIAMGVTPPCPAGDDPEGLHEAATTLDEECPVEDPADPYAYRWPADTAGVADLSPVPEPDLGDVQGDATGEASTQAVADGGAETLEDETADHYDPRRCLAVTGAGGHQCDSYMTPICGNHEGSRNLVRVDEFDEGPTEELRDELMEHCDIPGQRAYAMAVLADDVQELWGIVTGLEDVSVGPYDWTGADLATWADKLVMHPDLDFDWSHPLAAEQCIAITGKGERCPNGSYGTNLLCGTHFDVDDPDTVLERDGILDELRTVAIDGEAHHVVEQRDEDLIVITPGYELDRVPAEAETPEDVAEAEAFGSVDELVGGVEPTEADDVPGADEYPLPRAPEVGDQLRFVRESVHADELITVEGAVLGIDTVDDEYGPTGTPEILVEDSERTDRNFVLWPARDEVRARYPGDGVPTVRQLGHLVSVEFVENGGGTSELEDQFAALEAGDVVRLVGIANGIGKSERLEIVDGERDDRLCVENPTGMAFDLVLEDDAVATEGRAAGDMTATRLELVKPASAATEDPPLEGAESDNDSTGDVEQAGTDYTYGDVVRIQDLAVEEAGERFLVTSTPEDNDLLDADEVNVSNLDVEYLGAMSVDRIDEVLVHAAEKTDRPEQLADIEEGDVVEFTIDAVLEEIGAEAIGEVVDLGTGGWDVPEGGAAVTIYVEIPDDLESIVVLEATRDPLGDWSEIEVGALDEDLQRTDYGVLESIKISTEATIPSTEDVEQDQEDEMFDEELWELRARQLEERTSLSGRQAEVVAAKAQGLTHEEIAEELDMPKSSVDTHSERARKKIITARALLQEAGDVYPEEDG